MTRLRRLWLVSSALLAVLLAAHGAMPVTGEKHSVTVDSPISVDGVTRTLPSSRPPSTTAMLVPSAMTEGFEGRWPSAGWVVSDQSEEDDGEYLFGKRDCRPRTGTFGCWSVGGGQQGSGLACSANYPHNANTWAVYGPFDLSQATSVSLDYHLRGRSEYGDQCQYDFLFVGSSSNGQNFLGTRLCGDWSAGNAGNGYYKKTFDLANRLGEGQVWIAFEFVSDDSYSHGGFTIDDVKLSTTVPAAHTLYLPIVRRR